MCKRSLFRSLNLRLEGSEETISCLRSCMHKGLLQSFCLVNMYMYIYHLPQSCICGRTWSQVRLYILGGKNQYGAINLAFSSHKASVPLPLGCKPKSTLAMTWQLETDVKTRRWRKNECRTMRW